MLITDAAYRLAQVFLSEQSRDFGFQGLCSIQLFLMTFFCRLISAQYASVFIRNCYVLILFIFSYSVYNFPSTNTFPCFVFTFPFSPVLVIDLFSSFVCFRLNSAVASGHVSMRCRVVCGYNASGPLFGSEVYCAYWRPYFLRRTPFLA